MSSHDFTIEKLVYEGEHNKINLGIHNKSGDAVAIKVIEKHH